MRYYTSEKHFRKKFDAANRSHSFQAATREEFLVWQDSLRKKLCELLGTTQMEKCLPQPELVETVACDGYVRKKMLIHTEPEVIMPFYVLIPDDLKEGEKRTALIACHGHGSNGKEAVVGLREKEGVANTIDIHNYNYGEEFVKKGYIVFAADARGFGERREIDLQGDEEEKYLSSSCRGLSHLALPLGQTVAGMWAWDLMRLADYIMTCDFVNGHLTCVGLSGGGLQTLYFSALDSRVECAVISGYFYGAGESLVTMFQNCDCNFVPNLWKTADIGDIGALIAPRPLLIETGNIDPLNGSSGLDNVWPQVEKVRNAMKLWNSEENLYHDIFEGPHMWHGDYAYDWVITHVPPKQ